MRALVYTGSRTLELQDVEAPNVQDGDALIKIDSVGICGSDMHAWAGHDERRPAPLILGHEASGVVIGGPDAGLRVTINPLVTCGSCRFCEAGRTNLCDKRQIISMPPREGAFAEYLAMPRENLVRINQKVSFEQAALAEPLACGWHAVRLARETLKSPLETCSCLVIGGGAIGFGASLVLAAHGAHDIWIGETNPERRKLVGSREKFRVFDPLRSSGPDAGSVDLVIDAVGIETSRVYASRSVRPGGVVAHIGLGSGYGGLDIRRFTLQEITFIGTYTYTKEDFRQTVQAISDGHLGTLDWVDIRPLTDGAQAFKEIRAGKVAAPKIIMKP